MTSENISHQEYWDGHYSKSDGVAPTHEWYRSFGDLERVFQSLLFEKPGMKAEDNPLILHIGSGDSVLLPPGTLPAPVASVNRG
jgi:EEF1A lysine methyltransferase 4